MRVIKEPEIIMEESMAPEVTKKEDIEIETVDGLIKTPFEELDALFGRQNRMTESQKDKLWKEYKNKYIRWTGKVVSRGKGRMSGLRMGIQHTGGTDVELVFTNDKENLVLGTKKGDKITYTGQLSTRCGYILPYKLEDGNIESVLKEPSTTEPSTAESSTTELSTTESSTTESSTAESSTTESSTTESSTQNRQQSRVQQNRVQQSRVQQSRVQQNRAQQSRAQQKSTTK